MSDETPHLSIVVTVVGGKEALRRCLGSLCAQADPAATDIIVPYDKWSGEVGELTAEFPSVRFHFISDLGAAASERIACHQHRLYDRRRAVGLALARGRVIAMTEDYAVPAPDWCRRIVAAHDEQPHAVIGGAINNGVDRPLNWAWYYSDFGRYGSPLAGGPAAYVSDVNLAYKRSALEAVKHLWSEAYRETTLHRALALAGEALLLDGRIIVAQHRPRMSFGKALRERVEWGRVFAEGRAGANWLRLCYAAGTPLLPGLLLVRALKHMRRQRRTFRQMAATLPVLLPLLAAWALGEFGGYVAGPPPTRDEAHAARVPVSAGQASGL